MALSFAVRLQEFADKTNRRADDTVREVVITIAEKLDARSPVGNTALWKNPPPKDYEPGRFRGNWQLGVNTIPEGETGRIDPSGGVTLAAMIADIPTKVAGTIVYFANNSPYARPIEDGHSTQAPTGLVQLTALEFQSDVVDALALVA